MDGHPDGTFRPEGVVNRAELAKMIVNGNSEFLGEEPVNLSNTDCFTDVNDEWFAPYVCYAKGKGWVVGYPDGSFQPERSVNRAEAIKMTLASMYTGDVGKMIGTIKKPTIQKIFDFFFKDWYKSYAKEHFLNDSNLPIFYSSSEYGCEKGCKSYRKMPQDYDAEEWYAPYLEYAIRHSIVSTEHIVDLDPSEAKKYRLPEKYNYFPQDDMTRQEAAHLVLSSESSMYNRGREVLSDMLKHFIPYVMFDYSSFVAYTDCYIDGFGEETIMDLFQEYDDYNFAGPLDKVTPHVSFHVEPNSYFEELPVSVEDFLAIADEQYEHWGDRRAGDASLEELELRTIYSPTVAKIREAQKEGTLICE